MAYHRTKLHVRAARGRNGIKIAASPQPNHNPLTEKRDYRDVPLPTIRFAVELEIPDEMFEQHEQPISTVTVDQDMVEVLTGQTL